MAGSDNFIVITRDEANNQAWRAELMSWGHLVYELPCIRTASVDVEQDLLADLDQYDWLIFTSADGVRYFKQLLDKLKILTSRLPRIAAVGPQTAAAVRELDWAVDFMPSRADSQSLADELAPIAHQRLLLARSAIASGELVQVLEQRQAIVTDLKVYTTELIDLPDPKFHQLLMARRIAAIIFASPSAVAGFKARTGDSLPIARTTQVIAIGSTTARQLSDDGFANVKVAEDPTISGIIKLLTSH